MTPLLLATVTAASRGVPVREAFSESGQARRAGPLPCSRSTVCISIPKLALSFAADWCGGLSLPAAHALLGGKDFVLIVPYSPALGPVRWHVCSMCSEKVRGRLTEGTNDAQ